MKQPPSDDELLARGRALRHAPLTYAEVGATQGDLPADYRHGRFERGEESFMVKRSDDGTVTAVITVFSQLADPLVKLGGPIARRIQTSIRRRTSAT